MRKIKVAFLHPDLGIGGAERLVVDAALGLQRLGHTVDIYTSHHDPNHCFEETRDGSLNVRYIRPPFPRSFLGKGHILSAHLRQLHLTLYLLRTGLASSYDIYFVDQLSTCIPFLAKIARKRVVFYGHFPDKLLADGQFIEGKSSKRTIFSLKGFYRLPMDWLEEITTRQADILLANSHFTARIFAKYFPSLRKPPRVVYPGINVHAYDISVSHNRESIGDIFSDRPTLLSLNRFEKKKNIGLAIEAFALVRQSLTSQQLRRLRLVLAGGFDPRLQDNIDTLNHLTKLCEKQEEPDVIFVLNFTTEQRTWLLKSTFTFALLYTPANEHFGIIPVEGMISRLPVLACDSGGPTESVVDPGVSQTSDTRTGWLRPPDAVVWSEAVLEILRLSEVERKTLGEHARQRAVTLFSLDAMAKNIEEALQEALRLGDVEGGLHSWLLFVIFIITAAVTVTAWKYS